MTLSSHLRLFISGSLVTIGGNVALGLINYLVRRTMVWRLTETDFGLFWGTFSLVTLVCALADLGIVNSGTLLFAEKKEEPREIFSAVLLLKLVTGLLAGGIFFLLRNVIAEHYLGGQDTAMPAFFSLFILVFLLNGVFDAFYLGHKDYPTRSFFHCTVSLLLLGLLYFLLNTSSLCGTVAAYTTAYGLLLPVQMQWISRKNGPLLTCKISPRVLKSLFSLTGALAVFTGIQTLLFNLDSLMLTLIAGPRMTAVYNIALPVTQLLLSVLVFAQVFLPIAADMVRAGESARLKKYIFGALLITLAVLPCLFAAAAWCSKFLITLLFKGSYADAAAPVLPWLMCGYLLFAFGSFIAQTLIAMRRIGPLLIVSGATVVLDFSLMYPFIRSAGAVGAAMATCASYAFFAIAAFAVFSCGTRRGNAFSKEVSNE